MLDTFLSRLNLIPKKTLVIIVAVVLLIILIVVGAIWFVKTQNQSAHREATIEQVSAEIDNSLLVCQKEKNPDYCMAKKVETAALQVRAVELCSKLDGQDADTCVWKVAKQDNDSAACAYLSTDDKKTECRDSVYRGLAGENLDLSWCEKINSEIARSMCVNGVSEQIAREKGCQGTGIDPNLCTRFTALEEAVASKDPDQCMLLLTTDDQVGCLDLIGSGDKDLDGLNTSLEARLGTSDENFDSDNDGLSDYDEYYKYKTDPAKADTDGDSYNDGAEINSGYNPLGSGKL